MSKSIFPKCHQELNTCKNNIGGKCFILTDTVFTKPCPFFKERDEVVDLVSIKSGGDTGEKYIYKNKGKYDVNICEINYGRYENLEDAMLIRNKVLYEMNKL